MTTTTRAGEERRLVTIVFADVTGSTELGERLDPERFREVMQAYAQAMREEIEAEGGTVEKFIGDAVMAAFGVPTAHEDDPARALRAGGRMLTRLRAVNDGLRTTDGVELQIRIGINTGEVLATLDPAPGEAMVTGDAVNVAARLEAAAVPGQIVVAERTAASVRGFLFEDLGSLDLKGKARPVRAYTLVEAIADAPERGVPGLHAPMIGRDDELALLRAVFERVLGESRPSIATIYGDAGVGKSRLTAEFLDLGGADRGVATRAAGTLPPLRRRHHLLAARRDPQGACGHPRFGRHRRRGREGPQAQPRPAHRRHDARPRSIGRRARLHDRSRGPGGVVPVARP